MFHGTRFSICLAECWTLGRGMGEKQTWKLTAFAAVAVEKTLKSVKLLLSLSSPWIDCICLVCYLLEMESAL